MTSKSTVQLSLLLAGLGGFFLLFGLVMAWSAQGARALPLGAGLVGAPGASGWSWAETPVATGTATATPTPTATSTPQPCGPTEVMGIIDVNMTWYRACSPYIVQGNILVDVGVTLTIEPGVEVKFASGTYLAIDGILKAEGTETNKIIFTSNKATPARGDWVGINFRDPSIDSQNVIRYATVQYAQAGISADSASPTISNNTVTTNSTGIGCSWSGSNPTISNNYIANNSNAGIDCRGGGLITGNTVTNNGNGISSFGIVRSNIITGNVDGIHNSSGGGGMITEISGNLIAQNSQNGIHIFGYPIWASTPISGNVIQNNGASGIYLKDFQGTISNNKIINNSNGIWNDTGSYGASLVVTNNDVYGSTYYDFKHLRGETIEVLYNYWGTTNAETIGSKIYDYYDNFSYGKVNYSPLLGTTSTTPVLGPANPAVSITSYSGTTADPILTLALTATAATQMLVSDDHTFPSQFQWEPFAATKDFHTDGTKYIYAKFKDASGNESAIAFARPKRLMYISKSATLASRPVLSQVRIAADLGGSQPGGGSNPNASQARVAANSIQVKTFYRPIGGSNYTELTMTLAEGIYSAWIPGSQTANGIEYYFQVKDANGNVLATLPETNPATQPFSLPVTSILQQGVQANMRNAFELAVGLTFEIPAGALAQNTNLQVSDLTTAPAPPSGITTTTIGYNFSMADGTTSFAQPISITFNYAPGDVAGLDASQLRIYYLENGVVKLAGGTVDITAQTVNVAVNHLTDFFLAEGNLMYPAPVTAGTEGLPITIQASVVNYVPVQSATLYYRVGTGGAWQSLAMSKVGNAYQATIPGSDVTEAGLAYYIQASDGSTSATFPAANPANNPQIINVSLALPLYPGWNLISSPRVQAATEITIVLSSISGQYDLVYAYDASDATSPWRKYNVNAPPYANNLAAINERIGVWVHMTTAGTLTVAGATPTTTNIQLYAGWNLVGYPGTQTRPISEALASIAGKYTLIYAYDASDPGDPWRKYNVNAPPYANNLSAMRSRWGYWIKVTENCVLTISN